MKNVVNRAFGAKKKIMLLALGAILAANVSAREAKRVVVLKCGTCPCKELRMQDFRRPEFRDFRVMEICRDGKVIKFRKGEFIDFRKGDFRGPQKIHHGSKAKAHKRQVRR